MGPRLNRSDLKDSHRHGVGTKSFIWGISSMRHFSDSPGLGSRTSRPLSSKPNAKTASSRQKSFAVIVETSGLRMGVHDLQRGRHPALKDCTADVLSSLSWGHVVVDNTVRAYVFFIYIITWEHWQLRLGGADAGISRFEL